MVIGNSKQDFGLDGILVCYSTICFGDMVCCAPWKSAYIIHTSCHMHIYIITWIRTLLLYNVQYKVYQVQVRDSTEFVTGQQQVR